MASLLLYPGLTFNAKRVPAGWRISAKSANGTWVVLTVANWEWAESALWELTDIGDPIQADEFGYQN